MGTESSTIGSGLDRFAPLDFFAAPKLFCLFPPLWYPPLPPLTFLPLALSAFCLAAVWIRFVWMVRASSSELDPKVSIRCR